MSHPNPRPVRLAWLVTAVLILLAVYAGATRWRGADAEPGGAAIGGPLDPVLPMRVAAVVLPLPFADPGGI